MSGKFQNIGYTDEEIKELTNKVTNDDEVQQLLQLKKEEELKEEVNNIFNTLNSHKINPAKKVARTKSVDEIKNNFELQNKVVSSFCENISSDIKIKKKYSVILIIVLAVQFVALDLIFVAVGAGWLKYSDFTLNIFIGAIFLELIGLVAVIVKYLFKDNITESLRIIAHINDKEK